MSTLVSFEAAARHQSFKLAAVELNVTPAAVSHQVKALEQELKCTLFQRHHRGVELTENARWCESGQGKIFDIFRHDPRHDCRKLALADTQARTILEISRGHIRGTDRQRL
jgi:DNA-binding transcriptional LysR family regulator